MENDKKIPTICIVGRPNVGKSSLFNRFLGRRRAVVFEQSGTTRDRVEAIIKMGTYRIRLLDTGGFLRKDQDVLGHKIKGQLQIGIDEADILILVCDTINGLYPEDTEIARILRSSGKPVLVVANKTDNEKLENDAFEFFSLGFDQIHAVSCQHGKGIKKLKQSLIQMMRDMGFVPSEAVKEPIGIAIVGRPNVGKSSFVNSILSEDRVIVSSVPGTTRDSVDTYFEFEKDPYILIDTAGIRHRRKVKKAIDVYSVMRAEDALERSDAAILLLDAAEGITRDDIRIMKRTEEKGKPAVIAVNKWDLSSFADDITEESYRESLLESYPPLRNYPIIFISAKNKYNLFYCIELVKFLEADSNLFHATSSLNKIFEKNDPSFVSLPKNDLRPNFMYIVQIRSKPVEFKYFVNYPSRVKPAHINFIENRLRENLPLKGIPIKIHIAGSKKEKR